MSIMRAHGVAAPAVAMQGIALALGVAAFLLVRRVSASRVERALPFAAVASIALMAGTLAAPGMEGVHRWLPLGSLRLHASSMVAPAILVGIAWLMASGRAVPALLMALAAQFIHVFQPDAASATALASGAIGVVCVEYAAQKPRTVLDIALFAAVVLAMAGGAALAWQQPDPLLPIAHVEGIVELAAIHGPVGLVAAVAALAVVPGAIACIAFSKSLPHAVRVASAALAAYLVAAMVATRFGAFPVPLLGQGASPILGTYVGLGLIAALAKRTDSGRMNSPS